MLTPLRADDGSTVLVNRGFVPPDARDRATRPAAEPAGRGHRDRPAAPDRAGRRLPAPQRPAADRWYSRDVQAIAAARGLGRVAPYFVDADAAAPQAGDPAPVGGLTVVPFTDHHLVYALTWYALALMVAVRHVACGARRAPARGASARGRRLPAEDAPMPASLTRARCGPRRYRLAPPHATPSAATPPASRTCSS